MEYKGIIFDMDGVIIDSESYSRKTFIELSALLNLEYHEDFYYSLIGVNHLRGHELFMKEYNGDEELIEKVGKLHSELYEQGFYKKEIKLKPYAKELIDYLNQHNFPICLATSTSQTRLPLVFSSNEFGKNPFKNYVTGDMVKNSKPKPDIFLKACQLMGLKPEECLVIEDSFNGIRAGFNAGCTTIMVPDLLEPNEEIKEKANYIMNDLHEVMLFIINNSKLKEDS